MITEIYNRPNFVIILVVKHMYNDYKELFLLQRIIFVVKHRRFTANVDQLFRKLVDFYTVFDCRYIFSSLTDFANS